MSALTSAANPWVGALSTYQPGRSIEEVARTLGIERVEDIIKLASNENSLGPSPLALDAMRAVAQQMHRYPDGDAHYLRHDLAAKLGVAPDMVFPGHGSNEIIQLLGHVYLGPGRGIVVSEKAFVVYQLVAALYQAQTVAVPMRGFTHDLPAMRAAIRPETRLVFIANPNNPTGTAVEVDALRHFLETLPPHVVAVLDEAYVELMPEALTPPSIDFVREGLNVVVLRTFSKVYGLAGLRIGYAVAQAPVVALLNRVRQPFNVNAMAQAAARASLRDDAFVARTRRMVEEGLLFLGAAFDRLGLSYVPSVANFVLVKTGRGREVCEALLRRKVIARPVDVYGLPDYVRITVGTPDENAFLVEQLSSVLERGI